MVSLARVLQLFRQHNDHNRFRIRCDCLGYENLCSRSKKYSFYAGTAWLVDRGRSAPLPDLTIL